MRADDRVVDVLRKFVANRLAHFHVGLADEVVGRREPAEVGHSLQVPHDDGWFHANKPMTSMPVRKAIRRGLPVELSRREVIE